MDHGYEFAWMPGRLPTLKSLCGKVAVLQVGHYVPFLQVTAHPACPASEAGGIAPADMAELEAAAGEYEMSDMEAEPARGDTAAFDPEGDTSIDFAGPRLPNQDGDRDRWEARGNWLIRIHTQPRLDLYAPCSSDEEIRECPIHPSLLDGVVRQTSILYWDGVREEVVDDNWSAPEGALYRKRWLTGETAFFVDELQAHLQLESDGGEVAVEVQPQPSPDDVLCVCVFPPPFLRTWTTTTISLMTCDRLPYR